MALCMWCGEHSDDYAEFCADCGKYLGRARPIGAEARAEPTQAGQRLQFELSAASMRVSVQADQGRPGRWPASPWLPTEEWQPVQDWRPPRERQPLSPWQPPASWRPPAEWPAPGSGISDPSVPALDTASQSAMAARATSPPAHGDPVAEHTAAGVGGTRLPDAPAGGSTGHSAGTASPAAEYKLRDGRWIALTAAATVLLIVAAVVTLALVQHKPADQGAPASTRSASPATRRRTTPAGQTATTARRYGLVRIGSKAAAAPHAAAVARFLAWYFAAINSHDYHAYVRVFSPAVRGSLSDAMFLSGYGTTRDARVVLRRIRRIDPGQLAVLVTFTSHQQSAGSPTSSACTSWRITLYLTRTSRGYVLDSPPPDYQPSYGSCS
jgi:hypothetical protein